MLLALGLLPVVTVAACAYALRPAGDVFGPSRLALLRAALLVGGLAAGLVEVLSVRHALTRPVLVAVWSAGALIAGAVAAWRYRRNRPESIRWAGVTGSIRRRLADLNRTERVLLGVVLLLILLELLIATVSPPNNYDSMTYHLPKIEHWVAQRTVEFFPTRIHRQDDYPPGAEYLLLHLRLLTGGDAFYNLLQWSAGVGLALLASRIAGQLGGDRRAQVLSGFVIGTTALVALEASSTQTDLVMAAWVLGVATLVLDGLRQRTTVLDTVLLGAACGLVVLTKSSGGLALGPLMLIWGIAQLRAAGLLQTLAKSLVIVGLAVAMVTPFFLRMDNEFGNLLGPFYLRDSISMQRHDPASVLVNVLRIGHTAMNTPITPLNNAAAKAIIWVSHQLGVEPSDQKITFWGSTFPTVAWPPDEDKASYPVQAVLVLIAAGVLVVRPRRAIQEQENHLAVRAYAGAFWLALLLYVVTVKWQPWGNRLLIFLLAMGAPLAGLWLSAVLRRAGAAVTGKPAARRKVAAWAAAVTLAAGASSAFLAVGYGWPRRLVGTDSIFTVTDMQARFIRRPQWQADYEWAAAAVRASGAHTVGLVQGDDTWEYPWWVLLPGDNIVSRQSMLWHKPAVPDTQVQAIVCSGAGTDCAGLAPPGWQVHLRDDIGYALPPG
jgi:4-amino-4-deoxy-L-arabinose transferase-like glycosyltransferase